jgi:hypothetical protein
LPQNRGAERALGVEEPVDHFVVVLALEDQTSYFETSRPPRVQVLLRLALELVGLVVAVGDEKGC